MEMAVAHSFSAQHNVDGNAYKDLRSVYEEKTQHLKQDVFFKIVEPLWKSLEVISGPDKIFQE